MKKNQDKSNDKQNISQKYEKYGNIKTTYQTVTFCKLGKCIIMYHKVGTSQILGIKNPLQRVNGNAVLVRNFGLVHEYSYLDLERVTNKFASHQGH